MSGAAVELEEPHSAESVTRVEGRGPAHYRSQTVPSGMPSMGKYRAFLELGQGGTAVVYLGVSRGLGGFNKLVVLKMLKRALAKEPEFREMFLSEARLSARLNHPNIVQVYEVTERDNSPIIVMEYLEGKPLSDLRSERRGAVPLNIQLRVLADGLLGLHYSHELKDFDGRLLEVVHRDFTPHNLFVTYDGQSKVLDFGIAKLSGSLVETDTGVIKGKVRYMPPEQILGSRIDRRADVFAAGVILWEALTGKRMWSDVSEATVLKRVSSGDIPSPLSVKPDVPQALTDICMKALAPNVDERYATAADFRAALEEWLRLSGSPVSTSDVSEYMTRTFAEFRQATRSVVEQHLSATRLSSSQDQSDAIAIDLPSGNLEPTAAAPDASRSGKGTRSGVTQAHPASPRSSRNTWLAAVGTALLGLALYLFFTRNAEPPPPPVTPTVEVSIAASPTTATLTLDGERLPGNPFNGRFPRDAKPHSLVIAADGYVSQTLGLTLAENRSIAVTLVALPAPPAEAPSAPLSAASAPIKAPSSARAEPGRKRAVPAPTPATAAPPPSAVARPNCTPPYTIDANGFKVYKPGCL